MSDHPDQPDPKAPERHTPDADGIQLTEQERLRQRRRSIAIAAMLVGLAVLFYLVTIVRMGSSVAKRAI